MPNIDKKLRNMKLREQKAAAIPKSIQAEADQQATFAKLGASTMPGIDKVQMFMGNNECVEFTNATLVGNQANGVWAVKGAQRKIPANTTRSEQMQKKSMDELMKIIQMQAKAQETAAPEQKPAEEAPVEKTD